MSKPIADIDDPRLVKALAHPIRVRIMGLLERGSATPKAMAHELGMPLGNVSYHVRMLRDFGFVELERTRIVRGAVEHRYRATKRPRITAEAWAQLPAIVREAFDAAALDRIVDEMGRAAAQGKLSRPDSHISRRPLALDSEGFAEASKVVSECLERLTEVEARAKARLGEHDGQASAVVVAMLYEMPVDTPSARVAEGHTVPATAAHTA